MGPRSSRHPLQRSQAPAPSTSHCGAPSAPRLLLPPAGADRGAEERGRHQLAGPNPPHGWATASPGDPKAPHPSIPPPRPAKISPMIWERSRAAPGGRSAVGLAGALSVACLSERVVAHVNKDMLQAARLSPARVTLRDPSCAAQSNGTHFLLESSLAGCGALRIPALGPTSGIVRYQNAVVLRGSGPGVALGGSPLPARQAEDSSESIEFSCSSPSLSQPSRSAKPILDLPFHLGRVLLSLEVYSSEAFTKAQGPCTVSANSRVFVEVTEGEGGTIQPHGTGISLPSAPASLGLCPVPHHLGKGRALRGCASQVSPAPLPRLVNLLELWGSLPQAASTPTGGLLQPLGQKLWRKLQY
ncbi:dual specificity mitogen-activated protein kinase kinase 7 isoform X6 [Eretmochelys imbricata]